MTFGICFVVSSSVLFLLSSSGDNGRLLQSVQDQKISIFYTRKRTAETTTKIKSYKSDIDYHKDDHNIPLLPILLENEHYAVVSKPPLVPCHYLEITNKKKKKKRIIKEDGETKIIPVLQRAMATFPQRQIYLVHRLDAATSGCLLIAFSSQVARELSEALQSSASTSPYECQKSYYALCRGDGASLREKGRFVASGDVKDSKGIKRSAVTEIEGLWGSDGYPRRCCLVRALPQTGRYHQIRQHLGRENHPIVGETRHHPDRKENKAWRAFLLENQQRQRKSDTILNDNGDSFPFRLCLHCHRIEIKRSTPVPPSTTNTTTAVAVQTTDGVLKDGLSVTCPLPYDMQSIINLTDWAENVHEALPELFG